MKTAVEIWKGITIRSTCGPRHSSISTHNIHFHFHSLIQQVFIENLYYVSGTVLGTGNVGEEHGKQTQSFPSSGGWEGKTT